MDYRLRCRLVGFSILIAAAGALLFGASQGKKVLPALSMSKGIQISKTPYGGCEESHLSLSKGNESTRSAPPTRVSSAPRQLTSKEHRQQDSKVQPTLPRVKPTNVVIQLGVFRNTAKLSGLIVKLRAAGYLVVTTPSPTVQGQLNWLYILPVDSVAEDLQLTLAKLEKLTGLKGEIKSAAVTRKGGC